MRILPPLIIYKKLHNLNYRSLKAFIPKYFQNNLLSRNELTPKIKSGGKNKSLLISTCHSLCTELSFIHKTEHSRFLSWMEENKSFTVPARVGHLKIMNQGIKTELRSGCRFFVDKYESFLKLLVASSLNITRSLFCVISIYPELCLLLCFSSVMLYRI